MSRPEVPADEVHRWLETLGSAGRGLSPAVRIAAARLIGTRAVWPCAEAVEALTALLATGDESAQSLRRALEHASKTVDAPSPPPSPPPKPDPPPVPSPEANRTPELETTGGWGRAPAVVAIAGLALGGALLVPWLRASQEPPPPNPGTLPSGDCPPAEVRRLCARDDVRALGRYEVYAGDRSKLPSTRPFRLTLGLGALGLLAALALTAWARYRGRLPDPIPPPSEGPLVVPRPQPPPWPALLTLDEREQLAWGAGRIQTDEATSVLDMVATVRATVAQAGVPRFVHRRRDEERALWLVTDPADRSILGRVLVDQLQGELQALGIPHHRFALERSFEGVVGETGERLDFDELEAAARDRVLLFVADPRVLFRRARMRPRARHALVVLRGLARAAWVDATRGGPELEPLEALLPVLWPEQVPSWIATGTPRSRNAPARDVLLDWAAAARRYRCLAPPEPAEAWQLADKVNLKVRALDVPSLWALGSTEEGVLRLDPKTEDEARNRASDALRTRTGVWWREQLEAARALLGKNAPGSAADQALKARTALVTLEDGDEAEEAELQEAVQTLYRERALHRFTRHHLPTSLSSDVRGRLSLVAQAEVSAVERNRRLTPAAASRWLRAARGFGWGLSLVALAAAVERGLYPPELPQEVVPVEFVRISGGLGCIGRPVCESESLDEVSREFYNREGLRRVRLKDFSMAVTETTKAAYRSFLGEDVSGEGQLPVASVTWENAQAFCQALGEGFDLPSEAQWEYALRAGTVSRYPFGDDESSLSDHAWFDDDEGGRHPVATKRPNPLGLYDMMGNVEEFVLDEYAPREIDDLKAILVEPCPGCARPAGDGRVLRGGPFFGGAWELRSAFRRWNPPGFRNVYMGFRCVGPSAPSSKVVFRNLPSTPLGSEPTRE